MPWSVLTTIKTQKNVNHPKRIDQDRAYGDMVPGLRPYSCLARSTIEQSISASGGFCLMYILAKHVVPKLRRQGKADLNVLKWASCVVVAQFYLSAITIFEIERGIGLVAWRDMAQAASLR